MAFKKLLPEYILDPTKEEKIVDLLFQNRKEIQSDIHSHVVVNMIMSYPPKIRQRVEVLPQYKGMIKQREKVHIEKNMICKNEAV